MEPTEILAAVRDGLTIMYERYAQMVEAVDETSVPVPGFDLTVRELAVHVAGGPPRYAALANGEADLSALQIDKEFLDARFRSLNADNPETDPKKLAAQIREGIAQFMAATATLPADQPIAYYAGLRPNFASIASILLGEPILHGYDVATAVGVPWPIDPEYAAMAVSGYHRAKFHSAAFQPLAAPGLEATYRVEVAGIDPLLVRIGDGACEELPAAPSVDCVISADPMTALLIISKRLSQWPAIALGRLTFTGDRPELGPRFSDLFMYP